MKKTKIILLVIAILQLLSVNVRAQANMNDPEQNKVLPPSPTAASLGKYGEFPVSLYNGLIDIKQDIYTIKSGKLTVDVSLSYHSSGNKPSDIPGWVGLGFSLNAGGVITRTVLERPDDTPGGYYTGRNDIKATLSPNMFPGTTFLEQYVENRLDSKSDIYQFNFNGKVGQFVFDLDGKIRLLKQEPYKIEFSYAKTGSFGFDTFTVLTEDGETYTFAQQEQSSYKAVGNSLAYYTSSWYLTKINNLNGDSIIFNYTVPNDNRRYKEYTSEKFVFGNIDGLSTVEDNYVTISSSHDKVIYLNEIIFNEGKLSFAKSIRTDPYYVPSGVSANTAVEKKLDLITLEDNYKNPVKKWQFNYIENSGRLKLNTLTFFGSAQSSGQVYKFEYDNTLLPTSVFNNSSENPYNTNKVDYWGYYNMQANESSRIPYTYSDIYQKYYGSADRTPSAIGTKAEILNKITYPTGGYSEFEFEINTYGGQGDSFAPDPMVNYGWKNYEFSYEDGYFDIEPSSLIFTLTAPTIVEISRQIKPAGPNRAWLPASTYEMISRTYSPGTYNLGSIFSTDQLLNESNSDIHFAMGSVRWRTEVPTLSKIGPGLRIKSISNFDGTTLRKKSFEYTLNNSNNSSGILSVFPAFYVTLDKLFMNARGVLLSSQPINDIPSDPPIGYKNVTEIFPDGSKVVHEYNTYSELPDGYGSFFNGYTDEKLAHLSSSSYLRGLEVKTTYYNQNQKMLKRLENTYGIDYVSLNDISALNIQPTFNLSFSQGQSSNPISGLISSSYYIPCRFVYKSGETETTFDANELNPISRQREFFYDNPQHHQLTRIETIRTDGKKEIEHISYPLDYATGVGFINKMQGNHLLRFPVEDVKYMAGSSPVILSGKINIYNEDGTGLKKEELLLETTLPIILSKFKFSNSPLGTLPPAGTGTSLVNDPAYKARISISKYDDKGNILQIRQTDGSFTSYLWSYNKTYPIAEVKNADYATLESVLGSTTISSFSSIPFPDNVAVESFLTPLRTDSRLKGAMATTYTYSPLIGVTSVTDMKGQKSYYEYDTFQRLKCIKDQNQNIIKSYDYNYRK